MFRIMFRMARECQRVGLKGRDDLTMNWATALMKKTRSDSVSTSLGRSIWGS